MNYRELHALLRSQVVEVVFTKKNGEQRVMIATLMSAYLPEVDPATQVTTLLDNSTMTVWDVEEDAWRSFKMDSLLEVEYDDESGSVRWSRL